MTTSTTTTDLTILKTDTLGRIQTPSEQRETLLDAFEHSGMSGAAFAKLHGIRYTTFAYWRQRRIRRYNAEKGATDSGPFFEEVEVRGSRSEVPGLCVALPGGASVKIERADQFPMVAALLKYMEHAC